MSRETIRRWQYRRQSYTRSIKRRHREGFSLQTRCPSTPGLSESCLLYFRLHWLAVHAHPETTPIDTAADQEAVMQVTSRPNDRRPPTTRPRACPRTEWSRPPSRWCWRRWMPTGKSCATFCRCLGPVACSPPGPRCLSRRHSVHGTAAGQLRTVYTHPSTHNTIQYNFIDLAYTHKQIPRQVRVVILLQFN